MRELDTVGDGTGSKDANINASAAPVTFEFIAPRKCLINRLIIHIEDNANFAAEKYGAVTKLTNGVTWSHRNSQGRDYDCQDVRPVRSIADWCGLGAHLNYYSFGSGLNYGCVKLEFTEYGAGYHINSGESFRVTINDDLSGLTAHYFTICGKWGWTESGGRRGILR